MEVSRRSPSNAGLKWARPKPLMHSSGGCVISSQIVVSWIGPLGAVPWLYKIPLTKDGGIDGRLWTVAVVY